jgi:hypothetical protein
VRQLAELLTDKNQEIERLQAANVKLSTELQQEHEQRMQLELERKDAAEPEEARGNVAYNRQEMICTAVQTDGYPESAVRQLEEDITEQLEETDEEILEGDNSQAAKVENQQMREQVRLYFVL